MKLKVMTLDRRAFYVDFSDLKTVWDLKVHLCRARGSWLHPQNQRLLYAGQVLDDAKILRSYCIDERKFLLMLAKKTPSNQIKKSSSSTIEMQNSKTIVNVKANKITNLSLHRIKKSTSSIIFIKSPKPIEAKQTAPNEVYPMYIPTGVVKEHIMKLGPWKESEVRRALLISLNNPNRAIDYLITGKTLFPKMISPPSSRLFLTKSHQDIYDNIARPQSPEIHANSDIEYEYKEFSSKEQLTSSSEKVIKWNLLEPEHRDSLHDIQRLVEIGFPRDIVVEAFRACNGNTELAADLLYEQYIEIRD